VSDLMMDLDGDGRDELMVWYDNVLSAWGRDLKDLWSMPAPGGWPVGQYLRSAPDHPCTLVLSPMTAVDGMTRRAIWVDKAATRDVTLLDPGDATRMPLLASGGSRSPPTVCRYALPATPRGDYAPPSSARVPAGLVVDDPRWTRPLPWTEPVLRTIGPRGFLAAIGLALINVVAPLGLLWLAARRRPWTLRLLMALPIAAAVPLTVFQTVEPLVPVQIGSQPVSSRIVFALATLVGIPVVTFAFVFVRSLILGRWRTLALLAGLTVLATGAIAAAWLWSDRRFMTAIEHYDWSRWDLALILGAHVVGELILFGWMLRTTFRGIMRLGNRQSPRPSDAPLAPSS
jgi:hypothetical protein